MESNLVYVRCICWFGHNSIHILTFISLFLLAFFSYISLLTSTCFDWALTSMYLLSRWLNLIQSLCSLILEKTQFQDRLSKEMILFVTVFIVLIRSIDWVFWEGNGTLFLSCFLSFLLSFFHYLWLSFFFLFSLGISRVGVKVWIGAAALLMSTTDRWSGPFAD